MDIYIPDRSKYSSIKTTANERNAIHRSDAVWALILMDGQHQGKVLEEMRAAKLMSQGKKPIYFFAETGVKLLPELENFDTGLLHHPGPTKFHFHDYSTVQREFTDWLKSQETRFTEKQKNSSSAKTALGLAAAIGGFLLLWSSLSKAGK
ncbi:MAG: hypothetical protein NUW37_13105 [Planctomycetes bacterium]|nr:hypothetical protein [Planctomycetota bacterium]